ncbi:MAG: 50S ribosomal protein L10, partial [bacterium]|nr:50S ribosomal protein L10 [bacterium]
AKIKEAKSVVVADYRGLKVSQMNQLRDKIKEAGGEMQVVKNNLFYRALDENNYKVEKEKLDGPSLTLFANSDEISPLKVLATFGKTLSLLPFKVGFIAGKVYFAEELNKLAALPAKIDLQAKLVGLLISQPSRLVYSLNWNLQKLVLILNAVKNNKQ